MKLFMKTLLFLVLLAFAPVCSDAVAAQDKAVQEISDKIDFDAVTKKIEKIEKSLAKDTLSEKKIDNYVAYLSEQENNIAASRKELDKQVKNTQKQLDVLGKKPEDGSTEAPEITKQREELEQELAAEDKILKEADLLVIKIEDITAQILNARSKKVYGSLITKQSALINPMVLLNGIKAYVIFFWDVVKSPLEWYQDVPEEDRDNTILSLVSMAFILTIALTLAVFMRRFILKHWGYNSDIELPRFGRKVVAAVAVAVARGLIPAFLIGGCILWMYSTKIFNDSFLQQVLMITSFCSLFAIAEATVSRVTFAPHYEQWRLVNVPNKKASQFTGMIFLFIVLNAVATIQVTVAQEADYSGDTVHFLMVIACAVKAFFLMWFAKIAFDTYKDIEIKKEEVTDESGEDEVILDRSFKLILSSNIICFLIFAVSLFGYPELSLFILNRIIFSLIICALFELFRRAFIDVIKRLIFAGPWMKNLRVNKKILNKVDFWLKTVLNPLLVIVLFFVLLNLWRLPGDFILQMAKKLLFGFKIGGINISLIAIVWGIAVFFLSLTAVRVVKTRLANNIIEKIDMDDGIKHSLVSGIGFVGFIISILLAIIAVGVDLTNLAFIAGALSVGIGFGLQDVIKNLVSGIIILFERPFKVGDWVIMNGTEGTIKQINIRSTEMESFNRTSVIVPNATLLSSSIVNLTHGNNVSRQSVSVGVAYGSDVEKVRSLLLECAMKHKYVMKNPAPYVLFKDFGESSLVFELRCYTNDIWKGWIVPSDLRFEINRRFIEEGIEIPFPQIVVHSGEYVGEDEQFYARKKARNEQK